MHMSSWSPGSQRSDSKGHPKPRSPRSRCLRVHRDAHNARTRQGGECWVLVLLGQGPRYQITLQSMEGVGRGSSTHTMLSYTEHGYIFKHFEIIIILWRNWSNCVERGGERVHFVERTNSVLQCNACWASLPAGAAPRPGLLALIHV